MVKSSLCVEYFNNFIQKFLLYFTKMEVLSALMFMYHVANAAVERVYEFWSTSSRRSVRTSHLSAGTKQMLHVDLHGNCCLLFGHGLCTSYFN